MSLEKDCIIILDDKEEIPLQIEIEDANSRQYLTQPLTIDKVGLTMLISENQQIQLQKKIDQMKRLIELVDQPLEQTIKLTQNIGNFLPNIVFGPKQLQTNTGEYMFCKQFCKQGNDLSYNSINQQLNKQHNPGSNVSILIYKGETYENLQKQLNQYSNNDIQVKPIILINGKTAFKKLMRSKEELFLDFYQKQYLTFHQKFITSNHHSLYFQIEGQIGYYFVFAAELNKLDLIKWIYQGILRFIQPKFVVITSSNELYVDNINILQLFAILEKEEKYFGIQCLKKINYEGNSQYNFFGDFTDLTLNLDSMFKIKQFHDPLSCIYMWERIENYVEKYLNRLIEEQSSNTWAVGYNSILPKLMFEDANQELKIIKKQISEQQFRQNQFETVFNQFCELNQNINYQLRKCKFGVCRNVFQWTISKLLFLYNYFAISICFFFSFQCPYQVVYNILGQSVGYTAIAVLLPIFYAINVLLFLLLTQLYHFKDKIIEKDQNQEIVLFGKRNQQQQNFDFKISVNSPNVDVLYSQKQADLYQFNVEVQEDEYIKNATYSMNNELLKNDELFFLYQFPQLKYISVYIYMLIEIQNYLDFGVIVFILANIIIIYGEMVLNQQSQYEIILIVLALFVIFFQLITKRQGAFQLIFKFSLLSYFWQFLQLPKYTNSVTQRINQKKQLGTQLLLNFILFYTFISIESYYSYSGYILIGILGYLSIISLIMGFFSFISHCCYNYPIPREGTIWEVKQICDLKFQNDIQNTFIDKTRNLVACTMKIKNKQQEEMQLTQFMKDNNNIMNLTNTIKIKIKEDLQQQKINKNDIDLISKKIEEAVENYFNNLGQQQQDQQIKNEKKNQPNNKGNNNQQKKSQYQQLNSNQSSNFKMADSIYSKKPSEDNQFLFSNHNLGSQFQQNQNPGSQLKENEQLNSKPN